MRRRASKRSPLEGRRWSHYIADAMALVNHHPDLYAIAKKRVSRRTETFPLKHDMETDIEENKREWMDSHAMLAGIPMRENQCMPYEFDKLSPK